MPEAEDDVGDMLPVSVSPAVAAGRSSTSTLLLGNGGSLFYNMVKRY